VVIIAVVVFVVLNLLLVWPHFGDLKRVRAQLNDTRETMKTWNEAILKDTMTNGYRDQLAKLQRQQGGGIGNQQVQLQRTVSDQAIKTGVNVDEIRPVNAANAQTNAFYEEQSVKISFACQESQLVNFLFNVGNDPAMIRVRELSLKPVDANRYGLKGDATLSANYAKQPSKPAPKSAAPVVNPPAVAAKPPVPADKTIPTPKPSFNIIRAPGAPPNR
jgi:Tfp pilus assembly protein PilO